MLYLTRKLGESLIINDEIEVTVVDVKGKAAKLGITFPPHASVLRREVYDRIQAENRAAATADAETVSAALAKPATPHADTSKLPSSPDSSGSASKNGDTPTGKEEPQDT